MVAFGLNGQWFPIVLLNASKEAAKSFPTTIFETASPNNVSLRGRKNRGNRDYFKRQKDIGGFHEQAGKNYISSLSVIETHLFLLKRKFNQELAKDVRTLLADDQHRPDSKPVKIAEGIYVIQKMLKLLVG